MLESVCALAERWAYDRAWVEHESENAEAQRGEAATKPERGSVSRSSYATPTHLEITGS